MSQYETFLKLHQQAAPFILPNAWNAGSAQIIEKAGFPAIATSSGAIAASMGYSDGEHIPFDELLYILQRIKAVITIPLSVDMERGYSDDAAVLLQLVQQLIDAGVAGINIEDAQGEDIFLKKLTAIKNYLGRTRQELFINARTDVFLQKLPEALQQTLARAKRYQQAGADGLFVTAVPDVTTLQTITAATTLPVNVVATPKLSSISALTACGVKRISMAVFLYKTAYRQLERVAMEIRAHDSLDSLYA